MNSFLKNNLTVMLKLYIYGSETVLKKTVMLNI